MTISKSGYVDIKAGQWVVAFRDEYFNDTKTLAQNAEGLKHKGAGWDWAADRVLTIRRVCKVMPNTYEASIHKEGGPFSRDRRAAVIAAFDSDEDAAMLAAKLIGIGIDADNRIDTEMYRLIGPFAKKEREYALQQIHGLLPHIFGGAS